MAPPKFNLTPTAFTPPSDRSGLRVSFTTSSDSGAVNPIFPATYLQVSYNFNGAQNIFGEIFTPRDIVSDESGNGVYHIGVPFKDVPIAMVRDQEDVDVEVSLHAWKDQKYLQSWVVGGIKDWGFVVRK